jgi:hypothetical protein
MRQILFVVLAVFALGGVSSANATCLSDAEIETVLGQQVRSKSLFINTGALTGKPLCSGLTLAQQVQRMREAAFPDEKAAREAEEARQRVARAAIPASPPTNRTTDVETKTQSTPTDTGRAIGKAPPVSAVAYFDSIIAEDAAGWMMNRYDRGSMRNMQIIQSSNGGRTKVVYGDYTYNGGMSGWVKARFVNTKLECLEFWDFAGQCRPLGRSPSQGLAMGFAGALAQGIMSDTGSSHTSSGSRDDCSLKPVDVNGAGGVVYGMRC